jgi:hypothetical protein
MYEIKTTGEKFNSFLKAISAARAINAEVFEAANGVRRWAPAPKVTEKRMRKYREQESAYAAQEAAK